MTANDFCFEPKRRLCLGVLCGMVFLLVGFAAKAQENETGKKIFRAGASTANITPPLGKPIVGNYQSPLATHIHDELHARCLVLDDSGVAIYVGEIVYRGDCIKLSIDLYGSD